MIGKIIGAAVGLIGAHFAWAFVLWDLWLWGNVAKWNEFERFTLLYTILLCILAGVFCSFILAKSKKA